MKFIILKKKPSLVTIALPLLFLTYAQKKKKGYGVQYMTNMATLYHKNSCRRGLEIYHFVRPSLAHYICKDHGGVFPAISLLSLRKWT